VGLCEKWCDATKEKDKRKRYWTYVETDGGRDEILATELVEDEIGLRVAVRRFRYKDGRNMASRRGRNARAPNTTLREPTPTKRLLPTVRTPLFARFATFSRTALPLPTALAAFVFPASRPRFVSCRAAAMRSSYCTNAERPPKIGLIPGSDR